MMWLRRATLPIVGAFLCVSSTSIQAKERHFLRIRKMKQKIHICHLGTVPRAGDSGSTSSSLDEVEILDFHSFTVEPNALCAHLGHDDLLGACDEHCVELCQTEDLCVSYNESAPCEEEGCANIYMPKSCNDGGMCLTGSCEPTTGDCVYEEMDCDDSDPCTIDSCDPSIGCQHEPLNCESVNLCMVSSCDPVSGCVHTPRSCDSGDMCNRGSCDPSTGECVYEAVVCNGLDPCSVGTCNSETGECSFRRKTCVSEDSCQVGACSSQTGECIFAPIFCDDFDPCTDDRCDSTTGTCQHSPKVCAGEDPCQVGTCDSGTGECVFSAVACDDGDLCTNDICDPSTGECLHSPVECTDRENLCQVGTCDPTNGHCIYAPNACSLSESPPPCTAWYSDAVGTCNTETGECSYDLEGCYRGGTSCDSDTGLCIPTHMRAVELIANNWEGSWSGDVDYLGSEIIISGAQHQVGNFLMSKKWFNWEGESGMGGTTTYIKWKPVCGPNINYARYEIGGLDTGGLTNLTTHHVEEGTALIECDTWYYTHFDVDPVHRGDARCVTSKGNYDDQGGEVVQTSRHWRGWFVHATRIQFWIDENYAGAEQKLVVSEILTNAPEYYIGGVPYAYRYSGETELPKLFRYYEVGNCQWSIAPLNGENVLRGQASYPDTTACALELQGGTHDSVYSFSIKTDIANRHGKFVFYADYGPWAGGRAGNATRWFTQDTIDWTEITVPKGRRLEESVYWSMEAETDYGTNSMTVWVKDIVAY